VAHWRFGLNSILAFWIAYVLTRPIGASFADYVAFPRLVGGLGMGHGPVALVLTAIIAALVAYLAVTRIDVEDEPGAARARSRAPARHRRGTVPAAAEYRSPSRPGGPRPGAPRPGEPGPRKPGLGEPGLGRPGPTESWPWPYAPDQRPREEFQPRDDM
jgi:repeat uncharacterized protein DUF347